MHAKANWMLDHHDWEGLRRDLYIIRKLGMTVWARHCKCNLWERVETALRGNP